ncbi:ABC transporter permease [Persicitalea jodogahamensis]|uniref:ABC transporter permease n=1 Tax=Persicitalea jodogahamensis TaxID=402147 RepID=A0A8J3D441_9BACT|nr:ABC transporter permease [Persicitalea jodogahamensis]GHB70425.1 ABC transporter permease [Persicitalea jodogahamensis]
MFHNYFKIALRNLARNKTYSLINIGGLALGISVCFFALLYVHFELSYDRYHQKADNIYRLVTDVETATGVDYKSTVGAMAPALRDAFPEVRGATRVFLDYLIFQKDREQAQEEKIAYTDSSLFSIFTLPLVRGNPKKVLNVPYTTVLSESAARRYFGDEDPVGKTLLINGKEPTTVTGVMRDMPQNSHFRVDILMSMATLGESWQSNWKRFFFYTYLLLPDNTGTRLLSARMTDFVSQHTDKTQGKWTLSLEPLTDVYLHGRARGSRSGSSAHGSIENVYIFALIAVFVLFVASFNFINLTTALATKRAKEVGVRKVLGAERRQLVGQFLMDAGLVTLIAFGLSVVLCALLLPAFNDLSQKTLSESLFQSGTYMVWLLGIAVITGLVAGLYPALHLSGFRPLIGLQGGFTTGRSLPLRKVLVVVQFSVSLVLVISTLVVYAQLGHMRSYDLGFQKDHKLVVDFQFGGRIAERSTFIKQQFARVPGVNGVSLSSSIPGKGNHNYPTQIENKNREMQTLDSDNYFVDHDFLNQYQIQLVAGRFLSPQLASDSTQAMLINEATAKALGYAKPEAALEKRYEQLNSRGLIVGVVKDFHFQSLQETVQPLTLRIAPGFFTLMTFDIASANVQKTVSDLKTEWNKLVPEVPFVSFFADAAYDEQYQAEDRFGRLFLCLTAIAVLISCLGLFGLSIFSAESRTKEIGVRKVLGASVASIVALLSRDFIKLVLIAVLIASPIAWYGMNAWLDNFAYKIEISWWLFGLASSLTIGIALLTVSFQSVKAAFTNPVESLRSE